MLALFQLFIVNVLGYLSPSLRINISLSNLYVCNDVAEGIPISDIYIREEELYDIFEFSHTLYFTLELSLFFNWVQRSC